MIKRLILRLRVAALIFRLSGLQRQLEELCAHALNLFLDRWTHIVGLDNGAEIWRLGGLNSKQKYNAFFRLVATPVATPDLIVVPTAKEGPVLAIKPDATGRVAPGTALERLGERGLTRLLVEGGGRLAAALLRAGLVDRLVWIHAPMLIGGDGIPAVAELGLTALPDAPRFEHLATEIVGGDVLSRFRARR